MDQDQVLAFIARIYDAPGNASAWHGLISRLISGFGGDHAHLVVFDRPGRVHCDFISSNEAGDIYARHYGALDTAVHRVMRGPDRRAVTQLDMMTPDELKACPVQQEMMPRFGAEHRLWVKSSLDGGLTYFSAVIRSPRQGAFDRQDYRLLETLHPHIERAMRLHLDLARAKAAADSLEAGLDTLAAGLVLLDSAGAVLFANRAARAMLDARDAVSLERGRLSATTAAAQARLQAVIASALGRTGAAVGGGVALDRESGRPVIARVLPLQPSIDLLAPRAAAAVLIHDPDRPAIPVPASLAAIGLTPAETRLVAALINGRTLEDHADEAGLSPHTVRSTLKSVFGKTETHRQSELVALILRMAPP